MNEVIALLGEQHVEALNLPASAMWSAFGLAVGYGAGRVHCWLAKIEHPRDDDDTQA